MDEMSAAPGRRDQRASASWVGYPLVRGIVVHGDGRGRMMGYPTANVAVTAGHTLPVDGVYAGTYGRPDESWHPALISLGRRPTFHERSRRILEVHLLDFDETLYGEHAAVTFVSWLRYQQRFDSAAGLIRQIGLDVGAARGALAARGWTGAAG